MCRTIVLEDHPRPLVDRDAEVGEGDARSQWIGKERRRIDGPRPMRLGRREPLRPTVVEHAVVEASGTHRRIELRQRSFERRRVELQRDGKLRDRAGPDRREHGRNELADRLGIDDREADLI